MDDERMNDGQGLLLPSEPGSDKEFKPLTPNKGHWQELVGKQLAPSPLGGE
jgi:hypothetical protein